MQESCLKKEQYKMQRAEALFKVGFCLYLTLLFINQTELLVVLPTTCQLMLKAARYITYLIFCVKIYLNEFYRKSYSLSVIALVVCIAACAYCSGNRLILITAIVCIAAYGVDYRKIIKCATAVYGVGLAITILFCKIGILRNQVLSPDRQRYNLGFNWVTLAPIYFLFITLGYINWRREKLSLIEMIIFELINYYLYEQTDTRLAFVLTSITILFAAIEKYLFQNKWHFFTLIKKALPFAPFAICLTIFLLQTLYTPGVEYWDAADKILSGRLSLAHNNFMNIDFTLFGQKIKWQGFSLGEGYLPTASNQAYNNVDCSYFRIFFDYGLAGLISVMIVYTRGIYSATKTRDWFLVASYIVVLLFCITEQWMIELSFNPFVAISASNITLSNNLGNGQLCKGDNRQLSRKSGKTGRWLLQL